MQRNIWTPSRRFDIATAPQEKLEAHGYYHHNDTTPGFLRHNTWPICFILIVDNCGVKYVDKEHADHLTKAPKEHYVVEDNWEGDTYCGINLDWDYIKQQVHPINTRLRRQGTHPLLSRTSKNNRPVPQALCPCLLSTVQQFNTPTCKTPHQGSMQRRNCSSSKLPVNFGSMCLICHDRRSAIFPDEFLEIPV